ncbi:carbohydrate binding domain-containing protein, partial [Apibacter sp. B3239]|uniref:phage head spike fiber domain-containing protein n=1 Tax=Apibacter sp. B3239 TaxID=2656764 RepID=UPI0013689C98
DFKGNTYTESTVDIPADTFYLRISTPRPSITNGKYKVEFGDKATDYTDAPEDMEIQEQQEINIGAVNLLNNSTDYKNWKNRNDAQITDEKYLGSMVYKVVRNNSAMAYFRNTIQGLQKGMEYTFSFYCKSVEDLSKMSGDLYLYGSTNEGVKIVDINQITQEWKRFTITVKIENEEPLFRVESKVAVPSGLLFAALQLEEGNHATSYAPSYQDFVLDFQTEDPLNVYQEALK